MTAALRTDALGKRYGSTWALRGCTLEIPAGAVAALVGPNGAGKTTLLQLAVGLQRASEGSIEVLGRSPLERSTELLSRVGFVAQDHPLHRGFTLEETLRLGRKLNPRWDQRFALERIARLGLPLAKKVGALSGGQQSQVALTLALAKRPELLILDEPVAALDPLARREFLNTVLDVVSDGEVTVVLSSHIVAELERVCDYLVILGNSAVLLAAPIEQIVDGHRLLTGARCDAESVGRVHSVIRETHTARQTSLVVRANGHVYDASWEIHELALEEIVLAYLGYGALPTSHAVPS